jgi:hypothetical protein
VENQCILFEVFSTALPRCVVVWAHEAAGAATRRLLAAR